MNVRLLLYPFSLFFGGIVFLRRWLYKKRILKSETFSIPVICVGNLKVGGTGKTPHVEYLLNLLLPKTKTALLSRGYGRKTKGFILADRHNPQNITSTTIGDEPLQIFRKFPQATVAVSEKRAEGIQQLQTLLPDLETILLDDAYQHLAVKPSLSILLTEYSAPYFKDYPLPAGNLREFPLAAKDADIIIITKTPECITQKQRTDFEKKLHLKPTQNSFFTTYHYMNPIPISDSAQQHSLSDTDRVILFTGIANPTPLYEKLKEDYSNISHVKFSDHHQFTIKDIKKIEAEIEKYPTEKTVLMTTQKDYARLEEEDFLVLKNNYPIFVVPIEVKFLFEEYHKFNSIIENHVREN